MNKEVPLPTVVVFIGESSNGITAPVTVAISELNKLPVVPELSPIRGVKIDPTLTAAELERLAILDEDAD